MRNSGNSIAAGLLAFADSHAEGRFGNHCAWGLAHRRRIRTAGDIVARCADGRTYCFSTESAKEAFLLDSAENLRKASDAFGHHATSAHS